MESSQTHYFNQTSQDISQYIRIQGFVDKTPLTLFSAQGLFSADRFDLGTRILLKNFSCWPQKQLNILDLGCGYGLVSSYLASQFISWDLLGVERLHIDACDSSPLATDVTSYNLSYHVAQWLSSHVQHSDGLSDSYFWDKKYDYILCNPPFSAGKSVVQRLIQESLIHLSQDGELWLVVPTKKWAKSYIEWCRSLFWDESITLHSLEAWYRVWSLCLTTS